VIISVLRGRIRPGAEKEYQELGIEMSRIASAMPGFVSAKSFFASDGEGVTIVQFTDSDSQRAWRDHPSHQKVQERGRSHIFTEYSIHVASVMYSTSHRADSAS
jgi:heme-degrading monooxygenase HmoA